MIEFNPNYTVSVSGLEKEDFDYRDDKPYVVELSNGTKFLCFMHNYGDCLEQEILSPQGEAANSYVGDECVAKVKKNINKLNQY